jgi:hypothetical protein
MAVVTASPGPDWLRRAARLQVLTIAWMTIEATVALAEIAVVYLSHVNRSSAQDNSGL